MYSITTNWNQVVPPSSRDQPESLFVFMKSSPRKTFTSLTKTRPYSIMERAAFRCSALQIPQRARKMYRRLSLELPWCLFAPWRKHDWDGMNWALASGAVGSGLLWDGWRVQCASLLDLNDSRPVTAGYYWLHNSLKKQRLCHTVWQSYDKSYSYVSYRHLFFVKKIRIFTVKTKIVEAHLFVRFFII